MAENWRGDEEQFLGKWRENKDYQRMIYIEQICCWDTNDENFKRDSQKLDTLP
ncbi:hypothetical protein [Vibrio ponticus]|uniref:hypothetical protein n=1 Tax=Vibrio ponticus TaxID=265668 RepID=UPI0013873AA2|nr:hypothetical protein [Vibrio ponticus]